MDERTASNAPRRKFGSRVDNLSEKSGLDPAELSSFQRTILITDGNVTDILEAMLYESIGIRKIKHELIKSSQGIAELELRPGSRALSRTVLLYGRVSHRNYVHADSLLAPDRLPEHLRKELDETSKPIGKLIQESKTPTYREVLGAWKENASDLSQYFRVPAESKLIVRTYRILIGDRPVIRITEKFPESFFLSAH